MMHEIIVADVGGTHARFSIAGFGLNSPCQNGLWHQLDYRNAGKLRKGGHNIRPYRTDLEIVKTEKEMVRSAVCRERVSVGIFPANRELTGKFTHFSEKTDDLERIQSDQRENNTTLP